MPNTIAELLINIKANTAQLEAALTRSEAKVRDLGKTAQGASSGTSRLNDEFKSIGRTAAGVALGMGGLSIGVTAVKKALEGTIQAAAEDAASIARLKTAVENTGASYSQYEKQLDAVVKNGQRLGFTDNETRASLSLLAAQTGNTSEAMKRFALAQDLSRGANIDLETSSKLLGKVTEENVRVLQRYGISVKQGSTETELFAAVQQKFSGQAETFAKSTAGQFERTKIAISEAGESVGRILLPSVAAGATAIAALADNGNALATALEGVGQHTDVFRELAIGAVAFVAALITLKAISLLPLVLQATEGAVAFAKLALSIRSVAGAQGLLAAISSGGVGVPALAAAGAAAAVAFVALDLAARHFTGGGLIDYLTGATAAHKRAAEAARLQGDALKELTALQKEGLTQQQATAIESFNIVQRAQQAAAKARADEERIRNTIPERFRQRAPDDLVGIRPKAAVDLLKVQQSLDDQNKKSVENVRALGLNFSQLNAIIKQLPAGVAAQLADDLKEAAAAAQQARDGVFGFAAAVKQASDDAAGFSGAVSDFKNLFDAFDPATEKLKLQKAELEALKIKLGDAFSPQQQALLDGVSQRLSLASANAEIFDQRVSAVASSIRQAFGTDVAGATEAIQKLTSALLKVPEDQHIKLSVILPDLVAIKSVWDRFIAALQSGASVTIAIRSAFIGANPPPRQTQGRANRGTGNEAVEPDVTQNVIDQINKLEGAFNTASDSFVGDAGKVSDAGKAASAAATGMSYLEQVLNASSDGVITLGEALTLNLSDASVVALELAQAQNKVADAQFRQRIELEELAHLFPGLNEQQIRFSIALRAIAQNLIDTQRTAEQFNLEEKLKPALEKIASDFNALFNRPTRETAQLNLQRDELERRKLLLEREGRTSEDPLVKALDAQIKAVDLEIQIRQKDIDIMKDHNTLADKTLLTDAALAVQAALLTKALEITSGQVQETSGIVYLQLTNLGNAANETADALRGIGGVATRAVGGSAGGLTLVGERGPELLRLPSGSHVFSNSQSRGLTGESGTNTFNVTTYITADSKASQETMGELADMVDQRVAARLRLSGFAAGAVNQNTFTPGGQR